jgi:hypothetical protein
VATIIGEGNAHQWDVGDLIESKDGYPIPLMDGRTSDFATAEHDIREAIGKSYAPTLGYRVYAGDLATTFDLATGEKVDFGQFHGARVLVEVGVGGGSVTFVRGQATVEHYVLVVATDSNELIRIQPHRVRSIVHEHGGYDQMKQRGTKVPRMYFGKVERGCTGTPGFVHDTVEHGGTRCPVHEYQSLT